MKAIFFSSLCLISCASVSTQNALDYKTAANLAEVQSFDIYQDGETLHALVSGLKNKDDKTQTLHYLNSSDNGKHWSNSVEIPNNFSSSLAARGNDVQLAANGGNLVALWQTQGELPNYGALVSVYSHDGGKTWHAGKNPAVDNSGDQSHADVIADKQGRFHVVWLADPEENGYQSLRYARSNDNGENWQPPQKLDDSSCSCCSNTLAISPNNQLHVLYRDMNPRDMTLLSSNDFGANWQHKETVGEFNWHFDGCPHVGGAIAFDENNDFYASVWTGEPSKSGLYTVNSISKTPVKIGKNATHSDMAILENRVILVWDEMSKDGTGIFVAESSDKGASWSTPRRISTTGTSSTHPRIVAGDNNAVVLWTQKQPKQSTQWAMTWLEF
ncbi:MAG: sialidase family protein [Methylococcales bacterium]|nr:sialidase family protein [Methylococcales bacterium]